MIKYSSLKRLKLIVQLVVIVLLLIPVFIFLNSIHYNVVDYVHVGPWIKNVEFKEYEKEFNLLAEQIYLFVDSRSYFFREFNGSFSITEDGLYFYKNGSGYPENLYFHPVKEEGWVEVSNNYNSAFPAWVRKGPGEVETRVYPNYISFKSCLSYTRDGKYPKELVDRYKKTRSQHVLVTKKAEGWYGIIARKSWIY